MEESETSDWVVLPDDASSSRTSIVEGMLPEDFVVEVLPHQPSSSSPPPPASPSPPSSPPSSPPASSSSSSSSSFPMPRSPPPSSPPPARQQTASSSSSNNKKRFESRDVLFPPVSCVTSVIDFFMIVGLREETLQQRDPDIFFSYPSGIDERRLKTAAKFCFPERVGSRRVRRSASNSSLNQLIHGSDQAFSRRHVFCVTASDGSFEWGTVLVKEELLAFLPSVLAENGQMTLTELLEKGGAEFGAADRAYCVVSRFPLFGLHFDMLLSVLSHERSMRLLSSPSNRASSVLDELDRALAARIDRTINQSLRFDLFSRQISIDLPFADLGDGLDGFFCEYVLQLAMPTLLHRLSIPNLLRVFNAALLCKQILFRSRFTGVASAVTLAASLLIRPLRWEGILVTVLPYSMKTALQAPVPFIIGIAGHSIRLDEDISIDGILVDVDVDKVYTLSKFPVLPAAQQLTNNLSPILARFFPHQQNVSARPPLDPSADQKLASLQAFSCFTAYGKWLIGKLIIHLDSDSSISTAKALKVFFFCVFSCFFLFFFLFYFIFFFFEKGIFFAYGHVREPCICSSMAEYSAHECVSRTRTREANNKLNNEKLNSLKQA